MAARILVTLVLLTPNWGATEEIQPELVQYETVPYYSGGVVTGCGIRFVAMNRERVVIDASFNLFYFQGRLPGAMLKVLASRFSDNSLESREKLQVADGWLGATTGKIFKPGETSETEEQGGLLMLSFDPEEYVPVLESVLLGQFTLGFQEKGNTLDQFFEIDAPLPEKQLNRFERCQKDFFEKMKEDIDGSRD